MTTNAGFRMRRRSQSSFDCIMLRPRGLLDDKVSSSMHLWRGGCMYNSPVIDVVDVLDE